jgi:hypothetical protein
LGIDTGQHWHGALEDFIVQAHANSGQVLLPVDDIGLPRGRLKHMVDGAQTTDTPNSSRMNSMTPR